MTIRRRLAAVSAATFLTVLAACSTATPTTTHGPSEGQKTSPDAPLHGKTIAYIQTGSIPYYEYTKQGFEKAVTLLGGTPKTFNSNLDASAEVANVQNAITSKVDGVVLEPLSNATVKSDLSALDQAGIPTVVLYGYDPSLEKDAVGFQGTRYQDTGAAAGEQLKALAPNGQVAIITGTPGRADVDGFTTGFRQTLGADSRIVETLNGNYDRQTAIKATQDLITKYPQISGIFVHNEDMAIGVIQALGTRANQVAIVTQNGSPDGVDYLRKGLIKASIGWSPTQEGVLSARRLGDYFSGAPAAAPLCLTPFAVDTPAEPTKSVRWEPTDDVIANSLKTPCATPRP
ncbi:ABC-type sugar transport system substrate-binding protein [Amycolatopsis sulphurea]|uniref:ABC-type sugar transport system substrate-binding protein n=1 Tax=Amycolatopsis sulphurea TaxID=76022 RepID=A0A2A9FJW8_9PSEU|nr:sugar ABC transporter substrate-binding protein [Amycolatopsis sulphurea]PFG50725.1 ABC-type sugar transport system substrate-binding protein [Amycolatopsis sulphurea]